MELMFTSFSVDLSGEKHHDIRKLGNSSLSFQQLLFKAKKDQKLVMIFAYSSDCFPCDQMKKKTFSKSKLNKKINRDFLQFQLELNKNAESNYLIERYKIDHIPSLIITDAHGNLLLKTVGKKTPSDLKKFLKEAKKKNV
jgi:thioredoxin-related protein